MMIVQTGTMGELESSVEVDLAVYRHRIFVETLGWDLPVTNGLEFDQFDRPDTLYVVARDSDGSICGCARLLPTTQPYLLAEVFPELLDGNLAPRASDIWELSRFTTKSINRTNMPSREDARRRFCLLFAALVEASIRQGATRLITFTALGIERILRSIGMHAHRIGPPRLIDGKPVLAIWIELDDQTCIALGISLHSSKLLVN